MVRLVFRPYTKVRRSICTSESKRTSTRVSSGFVLPRHSSPSFGSQRVRPRCASPAKADKTPPECDLVISGESRTQISSVNPHKEDLHFHSAFGLLSTQRLAHMLNSLVRVSRRVEWNIGTDTTPEHKGVSRCTHTRWYTGRAQTHDPAASTSTVVATGG